MRKIILILPIIIGVLFTSCEHNNEVTDPVSFINCNGHDFVDMGGDVYSSTEYICSPTDGNIKPVFFYEWASIKPSLSSRTYIFPDTINTLIELPVDKDAEHIA